MPTKDAALIAKIRANLAEVKTLVSSSTRLDASLIGEIRMAIWAMENELIKIEKGDPAHAD